MEHELPELLRELKALRKNINDSGGTYLSRAEIRTRAGAAGRKWHREVVPVLRAQYAFSDAELAGYGEGFTKLIRLSSQSNRTATYLSVLEALTRRFRDDLIIPVQQRGTASTPTAFDSFFAAIANPEESQYLAEAVACAKQQFLRAAVVLGWSAAIDRIHRKIEAIGFAQFNSTSHSMANQTAGRFKRFNQAQNVTSLSDLREVFDNVVLWIIEGMQLIDVNQHTRLKSCFEMRCQGAHPGDAPITQFNLMSFFSDIDQIVLSNPTFNL